MKEHVVPLVGKTTSAAYLEGSGLTNISRLKTESFSQKTD